MNIYCEGVLHQIEFSLRTIIKMIETLEDDDFEKRPSPDKRSIGELLEHMVMICKADLLISDGASQEEMNHIYSSVSFNNKDEIKDALFSNYLMLKERYINYTEAELHRKTTSYWGASYSRYEWLLEILAHLYHHRGQLHAMLVHCCGKDPNISLFE